MIRLAIEVDNALRVGQPVVALETTLVAHGFPEGEGIEVARECESRVREAGAIPATIGVVDGEIRVGLDDRDLERFGPDARKVGTRDLAGCVVARAVGATTVAGTLAVCRSVGIRFFGTGGIGGVHRGFAYSLDISADLAELARTQAVVVCSGVKTLLDVRATMEALETLGVPVLGYRTETLPLFYTARGGPALADRIDSPANAARVAREHWELGGAGVIVANPPPESVVDVEPLIAQALDDTAERGIEGAAITPAVLEYVHRESGGRTLRANRRLVVENAALAAAIASAAVERR